MWFAQHVRAKHQQDIYEPPEGWTFATHDFKDSPIPTNSYFRISWVWAPNVLFSEGGLEHQCLGHFAADVFQTKFHSTPGNSVFEHALIFLHPEN